MKIKARQAIQVTFIASPLEDMESLTLMEFLMNNIPNMRVNNPSYRELKPSKNKPLKQISKTWEAKYEKFVAVSSNWDDSQGLDVDSTKAFIRQLLEQKEREIVENIGQLRQWLNEKPKDMLVTNEHILKWLELKQPKE